MSQPAGSQKYGNWALVTGASSGIGEALAKEIAGRGQKLVLVARGEERLQELARTLEDTHGTESRILVADLSTSAGIQRVQEQTRDLDVGLLVTAAGFGTSGRFLDSDLRAEIEMVDLNCRAIMELTRVFGRRFRERGGGGILLLSSIVGFQGMPWASHYAATKAYVQSLGEALYLEMKPDGIDVLAAAPGPTNSGFADRAGMAMGNVLKPEQIASEILNSLGKRATVLPGGLSKLLTWSQAMLPRWGRVRIMGMVMKGMVKHRLG